MNLWNKIIGSLDNSETGASGKKITALVTTVFCVVFPTVMWTLWAYKHNDWSLLTGLIVIFTGFITSLFVVNTIDKLKNNKDENENKE